MNEWCQMNNFSANIMVKTSYILMRWWCLDQHAELDFYSATPLKQQSMGRHVTPLGHILISSHPVFTLTP
jgi:hypothetical protein